MHFRVLRLLEARPDASQREIAEELGVSLGAINFCVKALIDKWLPKAKEQARPKADDKRLIAALDEVMELMGAGATEEEEDF